MTSSPRLEAALRYAMAGWPVFPTRPDRPACPRDSRCECKAPLTRNGFKDATDDPGQIRAWWRKWPRANVAIATGAPGPDVLDVDNAGNGNGFAAFNRVKRAGLADGARAIVSTPRGGLHVYFTGTTQPCGSLTRAGHFLDFKATGGYVLAPPSVVHGQAYAPVERRAGAAGTLDWQAVTRLLVPPRKPRSDHGVFTPRGDGSALIAWAAGLKEGNRDNGLYWAACEAADHGYDIYEDLVQAGISTGLSEFQARRAVRKAAS